MCDQGDRLGLDTRHGVEVGGRDKLVIASTAGLLWNRFENNRLGRRGSSRECDECQCSECEFHDCCFVLKDPRGEGKGKFI